MSKKYSSRATKMVLAALLASSMALPSLASAEVGGTVTRSVEIAEVTTTSVPTVKHIDFEVTDASGMLAKYVQGPGVLVERQGKKYIQLNLAENVANMITAMTVNGESIIHNYGSKMFLVPVSDDFAAVKGSVTLNTPVGERTLDYTFTPKADSIKEVTVETNPEKETTEDTATVVAVSSLPDGMYNVKVQMLKDDKSGPSSAGSNFSENAILKVVDGKGTLDLFVTSNHSMVVGLEAEVNGSLTEATVTGLTKDNFTKVISVPVTTIGNTLPGTIDVDMTAYTGKVNTYEIFIQVDPATVATTGSIYTYKPGTNEGSIMNGTYLNASTSYKAVEGGYEVTVSFPKGKYIVEFKVEGKDAVLVQKETATNPEAIYKFVVANISDRIPATIHIDVNEPAAGVVYNSNHSIEFALTGKSVQPFSDIENSWATGYIKELYAKGIFAVNNKFYPINNTERYQFALMLQRSLKLEVPTATTFTDIQAYGSEAVDAIKALSNIGVIHGVNTEKTLFAPNGEISRQDTAIMIYRLLEKKGFKANEKATISFPDVKDASNGSAYDQEAYKAITQLNALKIMNGKSATSFDPKGTLTRAEMARVLSATLEVLEGLK